MTYQDIKVKCNIDNYEEEGPQRSPIEQRCPQNVNHLEHFQREQQFAVDGLQLNNQINDKDLSDAVLRPAESAQSLSHSEQQTQRFISEQNSQLLRRAARQRSPEARAGNASKRPAYASPQQQMGLTVGGNPPPQPYHKQPHAHGHLLQASLRPRPSGPGA